MKKPLTACSKNSGWLLLEVVLSLSLLALVLLVSQTQLTAHWQELQHDQQQQRQALATKERTLMRWMLQNDQWSPQNDTQLRPACAECEGADLEQWFLSRFSSLETEME